MFVVTARMSAVKAVAPKMPPSVLTICTAASCKCFSLAAHASSTNKQSNPLSFASLIVVCTQTSVVTPAIIRFFIPFSLSKSSKSVWAKAPRPGLSMMGSLARGHSSGIVMCPGSPRTRRRPKGPRSPIPKPERLLRERVSSRGESVERSGRWPG